MSEPSYSRYLNEEVQYEKKDAIETVGPEDNWDYENKMEVMELKEVALQTKATHFNYTNSYPSAD